MVESHIQELMDAEAQRINSPQFIKDDPVQFPRRFSKLQDIEAASLLASTIAWGNRKMICRNCDRLLGLMADDPANFIMEGAFETIHDEMNIHRTFFGKNLKYWARGLKKIFTDYGSVEGLARKSHAAESEFPAWTIAEAILKELQQANEMSKDARCMPVNLQASALKRFNMALRWLVRNDGIVDMGVWNVIKPSQLFIPLDTHVSKTSRELGLLVRKSNDKKAVVELTNNCREMNPNDPAIYDFALFGIGMKL